MVTAKDPQNLLEKNSSIRIIAPSDARDVAPELTIYVNKESGAETRTKVPYSDAQIISRDNRHAIIETRPIAINKVDSAGHEGSYYGVKFTTSKIFTSRTGLSGHKFNISYNPDLLQSYGLENGFSGAKLLSDEAYYKDNQEASMILCGSDALHEVNIDYESLVPVPSREIERKKQVWGVDPNRAFTITGQYDGGKLSFFRKQASWVATNSLAAALGAIYGAGITPSENEEPKSPDNRQLEKRQRAQPSRKRSRRKKRR